MESQYYFFFPSIYFYYVVIVDVESKRKIKEREKKKQRFRKGLKWLLYTVIVSILKRNQTILETQAPSSEHFIYGLLTFI